MKPHELLSVLGSLKGFLASSSYTDAEKLQVSKDFLRALPPHQFALSCQGTYDLVKAKINEEIDRLKAGPEGHQRGSSPVPPGEDADGGPQTGEEDPDGPGSIPVDSDGPRVSGKNASQVSRGKGRRKVR